MPLASNTFRIFVSSTFDDLKAERDALQRNAFPRLRDLCAEHGCRFQAIDLRWGVSEEAGLDQQTVRICIDEIKRCQRTTPKPNFVVLLGDRYGWRPPPFEIRADEFESLKAAVDHTEDSQLLAAWYKRDDNAVPPVYCLQPRHVDVPADALPAQIETARTQERTEWTATETRLRTILLDGATQIGLPDEALHKYMASATEQEIDEGVLAIPDAAEHVFCFFRHIDGLPEGAEAADFRDLDVKGLPDADARTRLEMLKGDLHRHLPGNVNEYNAGWTGAGPTGAHLGQLCDDVYAALSTVILAEIERMDSRDAIQREMEAHAAFAQDRARFFVGRVAILETIGDYIRGTDAHPLGVFGEGGSGKSALMARAAELAGQEGPHLEIVTRFIGATPSSSDGRALLEGLCREISHRYGDDSETPGAYEDLVQELPKRLGLATADKPLALFLDSLDQLSGAHNARTLVWLPRELPDFVCIVASTRPDENVATLRNKLPAENLVELEAMSADEGRELLEVWLEADGRTLQAPQKEEILTEFGANGLPLYLRLAFIESRRWRSYTTDIDLRPDVAGIIRDLYERLASEESHGAVLVSHSLGYLAASRDTNGLSEDELLDVLSADTDVFKDFKRRAMHEPPERKLPVVVWSRLYFDLEPYLTERSAEGATLLTFYHRELGDVAKAEFLKGIDAVERQRELAKYFRGRVDPKGDKSWDGAYPRGLSELPYHLAKAEEWDDLFETLTAFKFLERKAAEVSVTEVTDSQGETTKTYAGAFALLADYELALREFPTE